MMKGSYDKNLIFKFFNYIRVIFILQKNMERKQKYMVEEKVLIYPTLLTHPSLILYPMPLLGLTYPSILL